MALFEGADGAPGLAEELDVQEALTRAESRADRRSRPERLPSGRSCTLSSAQQAAVVSGAVEPGQCGVQHPDRAALEGRLDVGALEWALDELVRRHEVLRTTFGLVDGEPVQVIAERAMPETGTRGPAG